MITKHTSGFCGVNMWMHRWKWQESVKCPLCDEPIEDANHVWLCQGAEIPARWTVALATLRAEMALSHTDLLLARDISDTKHSLSRHFITPRPTRLE
jgi:hypothetical protein